MFARSDEIPSLPVENIKEKPKRQGRTDGKMDGLTDRRKDNMKTVYPQTGIKHSSVEQIRRVFSDKG